MVGFLQQLPWRSRSAASVLRERGPLFGDARVVAVGQTIDERIGMRELRRFSNLMIGGLIDTEGDVLGHRPMGYEGLLGHDSDLITKTLEADRRDVPIVDAYAPAVRDEQLGQHAQKRGLAGTIGPNDGDSFATLHRQVHIDERWLIGIWIGEVQMLEGDALFMSRQRRCGSPGHPRAYRRWLREAWTREHRPH